MKPIEERAKEVAEEMRAYRNPIRMSHHPIDAISAWADRLDPPPPKKMRLWVLVHGRNGMPEYAYSAAGPPDSRQGDGHYGWQEYVPRSEVDRLRGLLERVTDRLQELASLTVKGGVVSSISAPNRVAQFESDIKADIAEARAAAEGEDPEAAPRRKNGSDQICRRD